MLTYLQLDSARWLEKVSMGTVSSDSPESSRDFLCFRLQRLRTSSETVSRAVHKKTKPTEACLGKPGVVNPATGPRVSSERCDERTKRIHTSQIGNALGVHFKLVTFQMLADQRQKCVKNADRSCDGGGRWMPVT